MSLQEFSLDEVVGRTTINQRIKDFNAMFPISIENGGTGATNSWQARQNLGVYAPEWLGDSTTGTLNLYKSINQYNFIKINYGLVKGSSLNKYYSTSNATFSVDVLSSTSYIALSMEIFREATVAEYLTFASALVNVSANGSTLTLSRNTAFTVELRTGNQFNDSEWKIKILRVYGYK